MGSVTLDGAALAAEEAWGTGSSYLPKGTHPNCEIIEAKVSTSSGGHPQLELTWQAVDGPHAGSTLPERLVIAPSALGKVKAFLQAVAVPIPQESFQLRSEQLLRKRAGIVVDEEPGYNDPSKTYHVVKGHLASSGPQLAAQTGAPAPADPGSHTPDEDPIPF